MLLACPNCNTVFRIEKTAIGKGRKVNCGVCKHVWFVNQDNLIEEKKASYTNEELIKEKKPIQKNIESKNQIKIQKKEYKEEDKINFGQKPLLSKEINRSSEFDKKKTDLIKKRKSFRSIIRWFLLGILLSLALFSFIGFYFRNYLVAYVPEALQIYNLTNIKFNPKINNLEIVDFAAIVDGDILVIKGKIYNNDFFSRLSPVILISGYNSNNEVYDFFKLKAENQIIKPGTYNYFRYETTEFDNISNEKLNEFNAELSSESINLEFR